MVASAWGGANGLGLGVYRMGYRVWAWPSGRSAGRSGKGLRFVSLSEAHPLFKYTGARTEETLGHLRVTATGSRIAQNIVWHGKVLDSGVVRVRPVGVLLYSRPPFPISPTGGSSNS